MTIVEIVKANIESIKVDDVNMSFVFGSKEFANLDDNTNNIGYLDEPIVSNDTNANSGFFEDTYPVSIMFGMTSKLDETPIQQQEYINKMRTASKQFKANLMRDKDNVKAVANKSKTSEFYNMFDKNVSGVILEIEITIKNEDAFCPQ